MTIHVHICLVGRMGSGKTTLLNELVRHGYTRVVPVTTRPPREGEVDKVDYIFTDDKGFDAGILWGDLVAVREYDTVFGKWRYGVARNSIPDDRDTVMILDPKGMIEIKDRIPHIFGVYLDASEDLCRARALMRGDNVDEINRRFESDDDEFGYFDEVASDYCKVRCVSDMQFARTPVQEANRIEHYIRKYKKEQAEKEGL